MHTGKCYVCKMIIWIFINWQFNGIIRKISKNKILWTLYISSETNSIVLSLLCLLSRFWYYSNQQQLGLRGDCCHFSCIFRVACRNARQYNINLIPHKSCMSSYTHMRTRRRHTPRNPTETPWFTCHGIIHSHIKKDSRYSEFLTPTPQPLRSNHDPY